MQEALLHYVWKNSLLLTRNYTACTGEKVQIISSGEHNTDGGPDFSNAKIIIDGTLWAGNVELHVRACDWKRHKHHINPAYDNVILHVVHENNELCYNSKNRRIPCIIMQISPKLEQNYQQLLSDSNLIRCSEKIQNIDPMRISFWLNALTTERLQTKTIAIKELLQATNNSWEEAFYIHLARSFGLKVNVLPFELLAKSTPLKILTKHSKKLIQLEALLFGQSGFLNAEPKDTYSKFLTNEYSYLKKKYSLQAIPPDLWKFLRLRPSNFPTIRIAQMASLIHNTRHLFSTSMEATSIHELVKIYSSSASKYWKKHYTFGKEADQTKTHLLGLSTRMLLIINTIVPFMFTFGEHKNKESLKEKAIQFLEETPAENNRIIKKWSNLELKPRHAADSQALLQLSNHYCKPGKCLACQIGYLLIST